MFPACEGINTNQSPHPVPVSMRVLVIEDDRRLLHLLDRGLIEHGFRVHTAVDGPSGLALALGHVFDVLVLDLGLPGIDGYEICARLRTEQSRAAILMLTARDLEEDVIRGYDMGADEYLRKPFSFRELIARIHTVARRAEATASSWLRFADLAMDSRLRRCFCDGQPVHLSSREYALLEALLRDAGHAISREALTAQVWGAAPASHGALDTLIASLRTRLRQPGAQTEIRTLRGRGYQLARKFSRAGVQG